MWWQSEQENQVVNSSRRPIYIVALDGGGVRGMLTLQVLKYIESVTRKHTCHLFDIVAGTSTGGIITLGLTLPEPKWAHEMESFYSRHLPRIFRTSLANDIRTGWGLLAPRYSNGPLLEAVREVFRDAVVPPKAIVPTYNMATGEPANTIGWRCVDAAMATSAGPSFFAPYLMGDKAYADGGVWCNNPSIEAVVHSTGDVRQVNLLSIGTGWPKRGWTISEIRKWGPADLLRAIISMMTDGVAAAADFQCQHLFPPGHYLRLQATLENGAMDDANPHNLGELVVAGKNLVQEHKREIDDFIEKLVA